MTSDYWSLEIENFAVRILPGNTQHPEYIKRTTNYYKLTGLPLNATVRDITPIISHLNGRTCSFTQTSRNSIMKNAYLYVDPTHFAPDHNKAMSTPYNGSNIFIYPIPIHLKRAIRVATIRTHILIAMIKILLTTRVVEKYSKKDLLNEMKKKSQ
ncbi:hypothetical protein RhiirA4_466506 [Rhizophagus irregularis]|uniref:Uncharacterized protein n=1 Tax=Rhizophagus irregularis TaxID=588596 RepID=A0A2I1GU47_9GLOM|nr:hypothetical protein RhiirA4_466506 [Rhizophagus irregularis]